MSMHDPGQNPSRRYAPPDGSMRAIVIAGVGLLVLLGMIFLLMGWIFEYLAGRQAKVGGPPPPMADTRALPSQPRLQVSPGEELNELRAAEAATLNTYGWVDWQAGIVRIPIERAIELLAERGLPVRREQPSEQGR